jgi:hypothetical protein
MKKYLLIALVILFSCGQRSSVETAVSENTTSLIGTWVSLENGKVHKFTENRYIVGSFDNNIIRGDFYYHYQLIAPNKFQLFKDDGSPIDIDANGDGRSEKVTHAFEIKKDINDLLILWFEIESYDNRFNEERLSRYN